MFLKQISGSINTLFFKDLHQNLSRGNIKLRISDWISWLSECCSYQYDWCSELFNNWLFVLSDSKPRRVACDDFNKTEWFFSTETFRIGLNCNFYGIFQFWRAGVLCERSCICPKLTIWRGWGRWGSDSIHSTLKHFLYTNDCWFRSIISLSWISIANLSHESSY